MTARVLRGMVCGRPKVGKTGGIIVPLLEAGFEVGVLNYDNNLDPVYAFAEPASLANLSVITCQDRLALTNRGAGKEYVQFVEEPTAMRRGLQALNDWSKFDPEHPWGPVRTWGPNRVLVLDSLTAQGDAAFNRIRFINNRNRGNTRDSDYGAAMDDQAGMLRILMTYNCHVLVTAHLKLIGPKEPRMGDDEEINDIRKAIAVANAENVETRWYPSALGRALPQDILRHMPASMLVDIVDGQRKWVVKPQKSVAVDIGVPGRFKSDTLPLETGILSIMEAVCGYAAPPK